MHLFNNRNKTLFTWRTPEDSQVKKSNIHKSLSGEIVPTYGDFTMSERAEERLRASEEKYRALLDNAADAILIADTDGNFLESNKKAEELLGYRKEELLGMNPTQIHPKEELEKVMHAFAAMAEGVSNSCSDTEVLTKDGRHIPVDITGAVIKYAGKTVMQGIFRDITERKQAEEALRESEVKHRNIYENAVEGIYQSVPEGRFISVNPAMAHMYGYESPEEMIASVIDIGRQLYVNPEERRQYKNLLEEYGRVKGFESQSPRKDGSIIWVLLSAHAVKDASGKTLYYEGIVEDITGRKQTEHQLEKIFLNAPTAMFILQDREVRLVNAQFEKLTGYGETDLAGTNLLSLVAPEDRSEVLHHARRMLKGDVPTPYEYRAVTKSGDTRTFMQTVTPIQFNGRNAVLGNFMDITDRKMLQVQLTQAQKLESIGQLAAGIAHEINTPTQYIGDNIRFLQDASRDLLALLGKYRLLLQESKSRNATDDLVSVIENTEDRIDATYLMEEIPKAIEQSLDGIAKVAKIVLAMKEFSHPGSQEKVLANINKAIENTITISRNEWKYVSDVATDFDPSLPLAPCLLGEFNQALLNIIVNAAQAIGEAKGKGRTEKGKITVTTRSGEDEVEIRVSDNGPGIPESIMSKIFDPFFTTKEVGKGTGQGLAIARSVIVDKHNGTIRCESAIGKGSTFIINLPLGEKVEGERT